MKNSTGVRKRVSLNLDPRIYRRLEEAIVKMVPKMTKQRYIEDAIVRRLGQDWRGLV